MIPSSNTAAGRIQMRLSFFFCVRSLASVWEPEEDSVDSLILVEEEILDQEQQEVVTY